MRYPVLLFDVGETLISPRESYGATYARVLGSYGLERPAAVFEAALGQAWDDLGRGLPVGTDRYSTFPGGERGYWLRLLGAAIARVTGGDVDPGFADRVLDPLRDAFAQPAAWLVYDDVGPTLNALRRAGVRLGVVSNWDSRLPLLLERLGLREFFTDLAVSSLEQVEKPDRRIFDRALARLDQDPSGALHVGDRPELDLAGAAAAGVECRLIDRHGRLASDDRVLGDLRLLIDLCGG